MATSTSYNHFTDSELVKHYLITENEIWLNALFKRYSLLVYGVCMKYLKNDTNAQDATQQVFEKCIIELKKYEVTYFKSWLYQITKNYCLMQLRKKNEFSAEDMTAFSPKQDDEAELENKQKLLEKDVTLDLLQICLKSLTQEQQQCIQLFYLEKKSYQEIADMHNFNYLQVKSHIQNGKRNLKMLIEKSITGNKK